MTIKRQRRYSPIPKTVQSKNLANETQMFILKLVQKSGHPVPVMLWNSRSFSTSSVCLTFKKFWKLLQIFPENNPGQRITYPQASPSWRSAFFQGNVYQTPPVYCQLKGSTSLCQCGASFIVQYGIHLFSSLLSKLWQYWICWIIS